MEDRQTVINDYVTDMAGVEKHILEAVERQVEVADTRRYPEALQALTTLRGTLQRHVAALEAYNAGSQGGGVKEAAKEALLGALGVAAGIYNKVRQEDQVSRAIRDTYTALGLATVSYHMLHTTALGLKEQRLADLALTHLKQLSPIVVELSKAVCLVVAKELADEDKTMDAGIGQQAVRNTQEAWSGSNVDKGGSSFASAGTGSTGSTF